jgi:hypothetical protein
VTVSKATGNSNTATIDLFANGTGKVTASANLEATNVNATSGGGSIGNLNVLDGNSNPLNVSAITSGKGTVSVTNLGPNIMNVTGANGAAITFKSDVDLETSGPISGTAITLTGTGKTSGTITVGSSLQASTGAIALKAPGNITVDGGIVATKSTISLTATGTGSTINGSGSLEANGSAGAVTLTSSGSGLAIDTSLFTDISALKSVTLTAAKGSITTGVIGSTQNPTAVTVSPLDDITNSAAVLATTTITEKSTSTTLTSLISINANIETTIVGKTPTGAITLTDSGVNGQVTVSGVDLGAAKSVAVTASKGSIDVDSIGIGGATQLHL